MGWWRRSWVVLTACVLCPPAGVGLIWFAGSGPPWTLPAKRWTTFAAVAWFLLALAYSDRLFVFPALENRHSATHERPSPYTESTTSLPGLSPIADKTDSPDTSCSFSFPPDPASSWPLRRRLAQLLMVGVDPHDAHDATTTIKKHEIGGIFIGGKANGIFRSGFLPQLQNLLPHAPIWVAVDDEGGRVQRIDGLHGSRPSARRLAASFTPDEVRALATTQAQQLRALGITMNLAPVVDVSDQPARAVIGDRSFSSDPTQVSRYAIAFAEGLQAGGIFPVLKHFPGHGRASHDSHHGPSVTPPLAELATTDLLPYREILGTSSHADSHDHLLAVMMGHLDVPGLTTDAPAGLDPSAYRLLRQDLGFDGVVMTDSLTMGAIAARWDLPVAAERALIAGADMVLWPSTARVGAVIDHLEEAVEQGRLSPARVNEAADRIRRAKKTASCTFFRADFPR